MYVVLYCNIVRRFDLVVFGKAPYKCMLIIIILTSSVVCLANHPPFIRFTKDVSIVQVQLTFMAGLVMVN